MPHLRGSNTSYFGRDKGDWRGDLEGEKLLERTKHYIINYELLLIKSINLKIYEWHKSKILDQLQKACLKTIRGEGNKAAALEATSNDA